MTTMSNNLKRLLEKNTPYNQKEFAELLGVKQNTYSTWESGKSDVKSEFIPKIANLFGVEIKDLFKYSTEKIKISQKNTDNKENSINGLIFIIQDQKSINDIVSVLKASVNKS